MEISDFIEKEIKLQTRVVTNPQDCEDCQQYLRLEILKLESPALPEGIVIRYLSGRLIRFLEKEKSAGLTFNGRPTTYQVDNDISYPLPKCVPVQNVSNSIELSYKDWNIKSILSRTKQRKLATWVVEQWLKQC